MSAPCFSLSAFLAFIRYDAYRVIDMDLFVFYDGKTKMIRDNSIVLEENSVYVLRILARTLNAFFDANNLSDRHVDIKLKKAWLVDEIKKHFNPLQI